MRRRTKKNEAPTEKIVIGNIVDHKSNKSRRHQYAKAGKHRSL